MYQVLGVEEEDDAHYYGSRIEFLEILAPALPNMDLGMLVFVQKAGEAEFKKDPRSAVKRVKMVPVHLVRRDPPRLFSKFIHRERKKVRSYPNSHITENHD